MEQLGQTLVPFDIDSGDDKLNAITSQWDQVLVMINHINSELKAFQMKVGHDVDGLEGKIQMVDSKIGRSAETLEGCITMWDGLAMVNEMGVELQKGWANLSGKMVNEDKKMEHMTKTVAEMQTGMNQLAELIQVVCQDQHMIMEKLEKERNNFGGSMKPDDEDVMISVLSLQKRTEELEVNAAQ